MTTLAKVLARILFEADGDEVDRFEVYDDDVAVKDNVVNRYPLTLAVGNNFVADIKSSNHGMAIKFLSGTAPTLTLKGDNGDTGITLCEGGALPTIPIVLPVVSTDVIINSDVACVIEVITW